MIVVAEGWRLIEVIMVIFLRCPSISICSKHGKMFLTADRPLVVISLSA